MNKFEFKNESLYCEDVSIEELARTVDTPFYCYSAETLLRHLNAYKAGFRSIDHLICFSVKANPSLAILSLLASAGAGADIVSGGDLYKAIAAGVPVRRIVYSGVGKTKKEIDYALNVNILMFNVESEEELQVINERAIAIGKKAPIALRINPDIDPETHPHIATGLKINKFGIDIAKAMESYAHASKLNGIEVIGIDCHIGSQLTRLEPFQEALDVLLDLIKRLRDKGHCIKYLDIGGGLGIAYKDETPPHPNELGAAVAEKVKDKDVVLIVEPGRVICGNAGILVTRLLYRKFGESKNFYIVDAGMNDLIRPALYGSFHNIVPVSQHTTSPEIICDVVGPVCESADFLGKDRRLPLLEPGSLLAVCSAGAYGFAMSSNYNCRTKVAEVLVWKDRFEIIRQRENVEDLLKDEKIPSWLKLAAQQELALDQQ